MATTLSKSAEYLRARIALLQTRLAVVERMESESRARKESVRQKWDEARRLLKEGRGIREISSALGISTNTVVQLNKELQSQQ
jgi:hypothetical protein